ncbi:MAG TPA: hypothetical protein VGY75_07800 [Candidatus Udaeobacter sp.]|jgi:hypothetical protein|nr:hypothetical protein [Candidatus Udaeobacter sp.]
MMSFPFGVQLGCYRSALRALIITGSVLKLPIPFVFSMQDASRLVFEADFNVVIVSALLFIVVQFWIIFCDWRRALFGFARGLLYMLLAGWGLPSAAV